MDTAEVYRVDSMRESGVWKRDDVFEASSRREMDDEEALVWAAIEKLPTYDRVRRGLLLMPEDGEGKKEVVDVKKLNYRERKALLERLVRVAEEDNERFLLKLRDRIDRVGLDLPTIEVRFEHLTVEAKAYVGTSALPTLPNSIINSLEAIFNFLHILPSRKTALSILNDVSGIIKPKRMTLLLGPPGSGKTTLLLALAGKLDQALKVIGKVTYNGHGMNEFVPRRTAAYISQHDLHLRELTVRETLAFSARCQGVGPRYDMLLELSRREKEANIKPDPDLDVYMKASAMGGKEANIVTDYIMKVLGLEVCADTIVGDDMFRGISGGQRKRVTTGEMLVGPARALFMDEISTGLDSSTTFQIVDSLRQTIHILGGTAFISLLQPAPETYNLFDDIILLSEGHIVYQGPREHVLEFFESMGFKCPERKGVADFLQEVTSRKDQEQYWERRDVPYKYVSVKSFSEAFHSFHVGQTLEHKLSIPYDKSKSHPASLSTSKYGVSKWELLKANIDREWLLMKKNKFVHIFRMVQLTLVSFIVMTVFLRTKLHKDTITDGGIYMGALFFFTTMHMFNGFAEMAFTIIKLPVFFKQRDLLFYPAWSFTLPTWILKIPLSFLEIGLWVFSIYYVVGFDPNVGRLFKQFILLVALNQMASGHFRFIGALGRNQVVSSTFASFALLVLLTLGGFVLSREQVKNWLIWGYWISPLMYAQNALAVNEFLGHSWTTPFNETGVAETLGLAVLRTRGVFIHANWFWIGFGALVGYMFLFNGLFTLALTYLKPFGSPYPPLSEDTLKEKRANLTGEVLEDSSRGKMVSNGAWRRSSSSSLNVTLDTNKKGMVLPFVPYSIDFENIRYSVDMPQDMKAQGLEEGRLELLKGINGSFRPGVLTALVGVSGAGKTTLMDVLAGRKTTGYIEGNIYISGYPKNQATFARISGYCEQNDIHSPNVTVYESLLYSAWLRLPPEVDSATRKMFVEEVMGLVELTTSRDALVGLPGVSGLSLEQRKRLTIAVELVANPSIIFMDEPTTGLDARAAAVVMRTVRNTVNTGRTVVCTIHQPSIDIFEAFDELLLLKRGGEEIYVGPLGQHSIHLINYFEGIQGVPKIKDGYNPATWMLDITTEAQEERLGVDFAEIYKKSELFQRNKNLIKELSTPPPDSKDLQFETEFAQPFYMQCLACLWKQHRSYWRNPPYTTVRFVFTTTVALMFGIIFWKLGKNRSTRQDLFNAMGSMYGAVLFIGIQNCSSVQPVVAVERTVFYRERAAGMYSALAYAFAQVVIELPYIFVQSVLYGSIVYAMIGFEWTAAKFLWYLFFMYFTLLYFTFYGMMAVGLTPNHQVATIMSAFFYGIWNLFSGFLIPKTRIPIWWRWYYYICPVAWTLYGLFASQFGDSDEPMLDQPPGTSVSSFVHSYFGFRHSFLGVVAVVVVAFAALFAFVFAFTIKKLNFQSR